MCARSEGVTSARGRICGGSDAVTIVGAVGFMGWLLRLDEPATLRLTVVTRQIDQRRPKAMKIRAISELQPTADHQSITVNVNHKGLLKGVTSQFTSQLNGTRRTVASRRRHP
jgi:hypothetical protein